MNATLRDNILMVASSTCGPVQGGAPACQLKSDSGSCRRATRPEIGERGINLLRRARSKRVAFARAVYSGTADVVVMDDPVGRRPARLRCPLPRVASAPPFADKTRRSS